MNWIKIVKRKQKKKRHNPVDLVNPV